MSPARTMIAATTIRTVCSSSSSRVGIAGTRRLLRRQRRQTVFLSSSLQRSFSSTTADEDDDGSNSSSGTTGTATASSTNKTQRRIFYVMGTRPDHVGKTCISMAVMQGWMKRKQQGRKIGYCKPPLLQDDDDDDDDKDGDAQLVEQYFQQLYGDDDDDEESSGSSSDQNSKQQQEGEGPVVAAGASGSYCLRTFQQAIDSTSSNDDRHHDVVICEGTGRHLSTTITAIIGGNNSNAEMAKLLDASVILVANDNDHDDDDDDDHDHENDGNPKSKRATGSTSSSTVTTSTTTIDQSISRILDDIQLNYYALMEHGNRIAGVVVNKIPRNMPLRQYQDALRHALRTRFDDDGRPSNNKNNNKEMTMPLLGCVPDRPFLGCPTLSEMERLLHGQLVLGRQHELRHYAISELRVVATSLPLFLRELRGYRRHYNRKQRTLYLCHASRADIVLGYLMEHCTMRASTNTQPWETALLVTGCRELPLSDQILETIDSGKRYTTAPILLTDDPTHVAMQKLFQYTPKLSLSDRHRVETAIAHYEPYLDLDLLWERSSPRIQRDNNTVAAEEEEAL